MGEGAARRGSGRRYPRPGPGTRKVHPPRWTLGTDPSSEVGGPLAREYRTGQNIWKKRLRISGTHTKHRRERAPIVNLLLATVTGKSSIAHRLVADTRSP